MATSTETTVTTTWTEIVSGAYNVIQNTGVHDIRVYFAASAPGSDAVGHLVPVGDGIDNATWGDGPAYARTTHGSSKVTVTS